MGGKGWRRRSRTLPLEAHKDILELDVAYLRANGVRPGAAGSFDYEHQSTGFVAEIEFDLTTMPGFLRLSHLTRHKEISDRRPMRYKVEVSSTPSNLGVGELLWLHCPRNPRRRVTRLFLPMERSRFLSRESHGLPYQSVRLSIGKRLVVKAKRLHELAGGSGNWRIPPKQKPPGMHQTTFDKLLEKRREAVREARGYAARQATAAKRRRRQRSRKAT